MKLISRLLILAIVPMMLLVACGQESSQTSSVPAPPSDAEQAARQAQAAAAEMRQTVNRLVQDNQMLTRELHDLQRSVMDQAAQLSELNQQSARLEAAATARVGASDAPATGVSTAADRGTARTGFSSFLLFIVFLIVALIVVYFIYRALKPRPFEDDEDDDFSSFDDDFGFDDEEDEESDDVKKDDGEDK